MQRVKRPPGPRGGPFGVRILSVRRDPVGFLLRMAREFGDVAYMRAGSFDVYVLSHPDHIRDVLVSHHHRFMKGQGLQETKRILGEGLLTSEGEPHRRHRRVIQPMFHHRKIAGYGVTMIEATERLAARWRDGQDVDVHTEMMDLTLDIVGRALFGIKVQDQDARRIRRALAESLRLFGRLTIPFSRVLWALPVPSTRRFLQARAALDDVVHDMIAARRRSGDRGDVLSMLLQARDEHGAVFDDRQVRDEAMTLLLAGHETTANALTWTWYLLSQHPTAERALHEEVDSVIEDRLPTVEDVPRLRYTEMAVAEAMRLYPPSWAMGRRSLEDHEVGGYAMPAGSTALLSQYVVHHDPRWYPDPFRFDPLRFTPEAQAERLRFAYFPFGGGPRMCIGESFAWMEAVLVVASLASRWRLRLVPGHPVALQPQITLRPKYGMRMRLERRR